MLLTKIHPDFFLSPISYTSLLLLVCLAQIILSIAVNSSYDSKLWKNFFFAPWYPIVFFCFGALTICQTFWKGLFGKIDYTSGIWKSPHRQQQPERGEQID